MSPPFITRHRSGDPNAAPVAEAPFHLEVDSDSQAEIPWMTLPRFKKYQQFVKLSALALGFFRCIREVSSTSMKS
jgi:hypothetical protein